MVMIFNEWWGMYGTPQQKNEAYSQIDPALDFFLFKNRI